MCGIVGYVGHEARAQDVILDGLRRLEYRGYDSAGIAMLEDGKLRVVRVLGKLVNLESSLRDVPVRGAVGIGHTRWATHGRPSERNAHPQRVGTVALVHNGIVENYRALREELLALGCAFESDTDTEVIAHLVHQARRGGASLLDSVRAATTRLEGSYSIVVMDETAPDELVCAKDGGSPAIVSATDTEGLVASDMSAILSYSRDMIPLEDGELARIRAGSVELFARDGRPIEREPRRIQWDPVQAEKGGYERFMEKEIFEQPRVISDTIGTRVIEETGDIDLDGIEIDPAWAREIDAVHVVGMGTGRYTCAIGARIIERFARVPAHAEHASDFRYRDPVIGERSLLIPVSQSGETADTYQALLEGKRRGARSLAVTNTTDSTIARAADDVLYTHAGIEICVASTKCYVAQIVALDLIALKLARLRGSMTADEVREQITLLRRLPRMVERTLGLWDEIESIARRFFHADHFLFLGRGFGYPVALEGALKLKEISYIHAEGYEAGEMKHGPIALIDEHMPVVIVANRTSPTYSKVLANASEVRARQGYVIAIADEGDDEIANHADQVIHVPSMPEPLAAIILTVPLQIFAYHVATLKGTDVDQPRNLAKTVTVE